MTRLAETAIAATVGCASSLARARARRAARQARASEPQRLMVVAMGKLGGGELNVSSDVDLVFVYPEEGCDRWARSRSPIRNSSIASGGA